jgi:hypothetical protein
MKNLRLAAAWKCTRIVVCSETILFSAAGFRDTLGIECERRDRTR